MGKTGGRRLQEKWITFTMVKLKEMGKVGIVGEILGDADEMWLDMDEDRCEAGMMWYDRIMWIVHIKD